MALIEALLEFAGLLPSGDRRIRRYERIGCLIGLALIAVVGVPFVILLVLV